MRKDPAARGSTGTPQLASKNRQTFQGERQNARAMPFDRRQRQGRLLPVDVLPADPKQLRAAQAGEQGETNLVGVGWLNVFE